MVLFAEDIWVMVKDYLFSGKFEAIEEVRNHAALPYVLSMHNFKGLDNNMNYFFQKQSWIFRYLHVGQVKKIIVETENYMRD